MTEKEMHLFEREEIQALDAESEPQLVEIYSSDPLALRERLDALSSAFRRTDVTTRDEGGGRTTYSLFERTIDPHEQNEIDFLGQFRLYAAAAGYQEIISPLVIPMNSVSTEVGEKTRAALVQLGYKQPATEPIPDGQRTRQLQGLTSSPHSRDIPGITINDTPIRVTEPRPGQDHPGPAAPPRAR